MNYNSNFIFTLIVLLAFGSCQSNEGGMDSTTIADKQAILLEKEASLRTLQDEILALRSEIIAESPDLQEKAKLVDTIGIKSGEFVRHIEIQGSVVADEKVHVVSEVPGRIISLTAKEGDYVKKGQLIAAIDMESVNKQIDEIKKSLELATDVYERQARLWEQNIGSEVQYLQAKNNKERLQKTLETSEFQLTKAKIFSPISGTVDMENLKLGEVASPGMPILTILNVSNVKVNTDLPERYLRIVRSGQYVDMTFPSIQMNMKGRVTQLGRTIDPSNRTLEVEITPSNYSPLLKPNLLAEIKIEEIRLKDVITIPVEFVLQEVDATEFVFIAEGDGSEIRAKKRYITTGEASNGSIVVLSGLNIGDRLITRGTRNVSDNELIEFFQTKQP